MIQKMVKQLIPFESLVDSIKRLGPVEQRLLWELLNEQMAQVEIREARPVYQIEVEASPSQNTLELKRQVASLLDTLSEAKLAVIVDFVQFLAEQERQTDWLNAQRQSAAYQEWVGSDNDIYDEVFADVNPAG